MATASRISIGELEQAIQAAEPAALLVPPRMLRRVIKHDRQVPGISLRVPHRKTHCIASDRLAEIVAAYELEMPLPESASQVAILLARPDPDQLLKSPAEQALTKYWRLLFHARVHMELEHGLAAASLTDRAIDDLMASIGEPAFNEIRTVLRNEEMLLPPIDDRQTCIEFIATYLELRYFVPECLDAYFPCLRDGIDVDGLLAGILDAEYLLSASRPSGAPESSVWLPPTNGPSHAFAEKRAARVKRPDTMHRKLTARAQRAAPVGNVVRAALLRMRASRVTSPRLAEAARRAAGEHLDVLARRLATALRLDDASHGEWVQCLWALAERADATLWSPEGRLLYDLQKVCVDHERGVYQLDVVGWITSLGRKPIKRELPRLREVLICKHLAAASRRLKAVRLPDEVGRCLAELLAKARAHAEDNLRTRFRPLLAAALENAGLQAQSLPEAVARKKLIEELLDRIVARGFIAMGDLRDALSRNNLKLPDLADKEEFLWGDPLLRADRQMAEDLDGVYRRGEVYLRWPQRLSSLAFGTPWGRHFTKYVAAPFGGAYLALMGVEETVAVVTEFTTGGHPVITTPLSVFALGLLIFGLLHFPAFRHVWVVVFRGIGLALRRIFYDLPRWIAYWPPVQALLGSRAFWMAFRYGIKPALIAASIIATLVAFTDIEFSAARIAAVFLAVNVTINSRIGRMADEWLTDAVARGWRQLRIRILAAIYTFIMDVFQQFLDGVERALYAVDEWFRFKSGDSQLTTVIKAPLAIVWSAITYVVRLCVNVCIEPQINPIKHFPVVTVAAKIIIPWSIYFFGSLRPVLGSFSVNILQAVSVSLLPGVFGFVAWELKENWRLYAANRSRQLKPVGIGSHGETMLRLLRPGFHSGTLPKLFARLRRAGRKALWTGRMKAVRKHRQSIEHVRESLRSFVERELLVLLDRSGQLGKHRVEVGEIELTTNRVRIELCCPQASDESLWISFVYQSGWLVGGIDRTGWLDHMSRRQAGVVLMGLAGVFKMAGVELLREQLDAILSTRGLEYHIVEQGVAVRRRGAPADEATLSLRTNEELASRRNGAFLPASLFELKADDLLFSRTPLYWSDWVNAWSDAAGDARHPIVETLRQALFGEATAAPHILSTAYSRPA